MYFHDNDKNDNLDSNLLFGHSFDELNVNNESLFNLEATNFNSLPAYHTSLNILQQDNASSPSSSSGLFSNENDHNMIFYDNSNMLSNDDPQQMNTSILLSDPNYIRQQELLQKANECVIRDNQINNNQDHHPRSNLSVMFGKSAKQPSLSPIQLISSQQQEKDIRSQHYNQNRESFSSNNNGNTATSATVKPIPISTANNVTDNDNISYSSSPSVDHYRRFNELQARFRVNYNSKSNNSQQQQQASPHTMLRTSMPVLINHKRPAHNLSSSFTNGNKRFSSSSLDQKNTTTSNNSISSSFPSRSMPIQIQRIHHSKTHSNSNNDDLERKQKRLDDQLLKVDFEDITVSELKELLRQRGKPATGKKAILMQRLLEERDMIQYARANGIFILNRCHPQQPSSTDNHVMSNSLPDSHSLGLLNRSIASMQIGSPPPRRRYAPYLATNSVSSPRYSHSYSTSVPSTAGNLDTMMKMMIEQQEQTQQQPQQRNDYQTVANSTPSSLPIGTSISNDYLFDQQEKNQSNGLLSNELEWMDPSLKEFLSQQGNMHK
ncbi:MAG: hypothetical protein EXX96DRAFT_49597 [Benjaminiella poitrasii]|nr:MAG: hypothetical protein EXX96DRAFT_49597 [Benjaminiella poitrasii]